MIDEAVEEEIQATRQLEQLKLDAQAEEEAFEEKFGGYLKVSFEFHKATKTQSCLGFARRSS